MRTNKKIYLLCFLFLSGIVLSGSVSPARAQDFPSLLNQLLLKSFSKKIRAVKAMGAGGGDRVVPILTALLEKRLYVSQNARTIYIVKPVDGQFTLRDAATGQSAGTAPRNTLKKIRTNNRLRRVIRSILGGLSLLSKDNATRLKAANTVLKSYDQGDLATLEQAIKVEKSGHIKEVMLAARSAIILSSNAHETEKIAAIAHLRNFGGSNLLALLSPLATDKNQNIAMAATAAITEIKSDQALWGALQNVIFGLSLGSVLLLAAIGLAITFGVMGVINMAHGEMVMIGAYVTFVVQEFIRTSMPGLFDYSLFIALPIAFVSTCAIGIAMERGIIRFLYGRPLETLLATWGVSLFLQQAVRSIFGPNNQKVGTPSWMSGSVEFGQVALTWNRLYIILFAIAVFGALFVVIQKTTFGLQMRAVVQNRRMAGSVGIRTKWIDALTFGVGSGIAGIAGVALSQIDNVSPNLGQAYIVDSFMVVVFGGVGNLWGTLVGAFSLGIANKFLEPYAGAVLAKIFVLVFIILFIQKRPRGLFALKGRAVES